MNLSDDDMKSLENDCDWHFVTLGDQVGQMTSLFSDSFLQAVTMLNLYSVININAVIVFSFILKQSFGIKTAGLEEKATACQMLVCYARELKEGFAAYAEEVVKIMVQHLKFYFHDGTFLSVSLGHLSYYLSYSWHFTLQYLLFWPPVNRSPHFV